MTHSQLHFPNVVQEAIDLEYWRLELPNEDLFELKRYLEKEHKFREVHWKDDETLLDILFLIKEQKNRQYQNFDIIYRISKNDIAWGLGKAIAEWFDLGQPRRDDTSDMFG